MTLLSQLDIFRGYKGAERELHPVGARLGKDG